MIGLPYWYKSFPITGSNHRVHTLCSFTLKIYIISREWGRGDEKEGGD
jgi:hypothetical protein